MTKITHVTQVESFLVELRFSDGSVGEYNLGPIVQRDTVLTRPLADITFFRSFFLELGALAWTNRFELSGDALHKELEEQGGSSELDCYNSSPMRAASMGVRPIATETRSISTLPRACS